jgi:hypothetical protein
VPCGEKRQKLGKLGPFSLRNFEQIGDGEGVEGGDRVP